MRRTSYKLRWENGGRRKPARHGRCLYCDIYFPLISLLLLQSYLRWEGSGAAARLAEDITDITGGISPVVSLQIPLLQTYSN